MPHRCAFRCPLPLAVCLVLSACSDPEEFARIDVADASAAPACVAASFPFEGELLSLRSRAEKLGVFLQSAPDINARHDVLYIELLRPDEPLIGVDIMLSPDAPQAIARARLAFFSSCYPAHHSYDLEGTLRFESLEPEARGLVAGTLTDARAIDARSGEAHLEGLSASWNFVVRRGPPYEDFYALPESP
ncbi:hypothetical protein DL240_12735 [Lujinxingia litoralis]|uniref:Lipoprotein n=1 Tax=Lujinxingia litoralis TaxID=2211119 RepID=A0A328C3U8_9DELT|nr:hypothetical protein [Lujinxingia litoralis]RAL21714.1 hypothetical protein DL240_12735 [Lujinxingia litoralis]